MSSLAARTIDALRTEHDALAAFATSLTDEQLSAPSGASEWSVAQVLSHLGSGSEIALAGLKAALGQGEVPGDDFNRSVWERWDAMDAREQRNEFIAHDGELVAALEGLTTDQHSSLEVVVGFMPVPLSVSAFAGMRLNEVAHHSWDARVSTDADAGLLDGSTPVVLEHATGDLAFLLGFLGKADRVGERVVLAIGGTGHMLVIDDGVGAGSSDDKATATFDGPVEAALRLITGRLGPSHTPATVSITGNATLEQLREVFPGF